MKKVSAVFVTDTHLSKDNIPLVTSIFDQLIKLCERVGANKVIHGGDIFTARSGQPLACLVAWNEILKKFERSGITLFAIPGNHDKTDANDESSYLDVFNSESFVVKSGGGVVETENLLFVLVPYFREEKWTEVHERATLGNLGFGKKRILITHMGFDGVRNNDGSEVKSNLKPSDFKSYEAVLIGHYHNASKLGKNVYYTGSAYQSNFGETAQDKGFTIIYEDATIEHVRSEFPQYRKVVINAKDKDALREALEELEDDEHAKTDHLRFVFEGAKTDCDKVNVAELQSKYGIDCKFVLEETARAMEFAEDESVASYDKGTILSDFEEFCNDSDIPENKRAYARELLSEI